jgi:hypothetical protein
MQNQLPLTNKRVYLSGAIEHDLSGHNWRINPSKILREEFKLNLFDPFSDPKQSCTVQLMQAREERDFDTMVAIAKNFVRKDLCSVDRSDFLIAYLPYQVPTTGTHHEIINSNNSKKPTLLVADGNKARIPLWYFGFIPVEFMFDDWKQLYSYLREINEYKHINNNRWAYVYGLI